MAKLYVIAIYNGPLDKYGDLLIYSFNPNVLLREGNNWQPEDHSWTEERIREKPEWFFVIPEHTVKSKIWRLL